MGHGRRFEFIRMLTKAHLVWKIISHNNKGSTERLATARAALGPQAGGPEEGTPGERVRLKKQEQSMCYILLKDFRAVERSSEPVKHSSTFLKSTRSRRGWRSSTT